MTKKSYNKNKTKSYNKNKTKSYNKNKRNIKKKQKGGMEDYHCNGIIPNIKIIPEKGFDLKALLDKTGVGMPPDINL